MAQESFEDEEVAEVLNRDYIAIKVDKEERPDVDAVYMTVCQALTGQGGWPLTIMMSPDQKPFYAATYIPKVRRYQIPGLLEILDAVTKEWKDNREALVRTGEKIVRALEGQKQQNPLTEKVSIDKEILAKAKEMLWQSFDSHYGGFGRSPKFPMPHNLMFLLRYSSFEKDPQALEMVEKTLDQMYRGGIFDHIGYGFARYSTDEKWLAPHFEKMLYDNALLAIIYLEAFQVTGSKLYADIAEKTMSYILREMTHEEGGFYSAQDADSDGIEGKYYLFSPDEIIRLLGEEDAAYFNRYFDISNKGNFEGSSIPNLIKNDSYREMDQRIMEMIPKVYDYRKKRTALHKDDKVLTSWNGLMVVAFAKAFRALEKNKYLGVAEKSLSFLLTKLYDDQGRLLIRYREGEAAGQGTLEDYGFLAWALTEVYESTMNPRYLDAAMALVGKMKEQFWDEEAGGFYLTAKDGEQLIYRPKETYDGAIPSGNSVAGYVLMKLSKLTGMAELREWALKQLHFLSHHAETHPAGHSFALMALMMETYPEGFLCENGVC